MLKLKKDDYEFFFELLDKEQQNILIPVATIQGEDAIIDDEEIEVDLYDWLNDLVVQEGLDEGYNPNSIGKRLEAISDYVYSVIEA